MDPRLSYVREYLQTLADFLGFRYWVFHISEEQCSDNSWCEIEVQDYNEATVKLSPKFWAASSQLKTQSLLHELFHAPVVRIHSDVTDAVESVTKWIPKGRQPEARDLVKIHLKAAHRREEEHVNHLAVLLSQFAPPWAE